jgi:putative ABC transport system permease protein
LPAEAKSVSYKIVAVETDPDRALNYRPKFTLSTQDLKTIYDFERRGTPGYQEFISVTAEVGPTANFDQAEAQVKDLGYDAFSAKEIQKTLFQFINIVEYGIAGFGGLAVLAAIFGIINTQYISVLERTRQIGVMKSLGMRGRDVMKLFTFEAAWIGFLGGVIGAGLAWLTGVIANPFISKALDLGDSQLLLFDWLPVIGLVVSLIVIAMLAGLLPARKAAKLDPIEALRTE